MSPPTLARPSPADPSPVQRFVLGTLDVEHHGTALIVYLIVVAGRAPAAGDLGSPMTVARR